MPDQPRVEVSRPRAGRVRIRDNRPRSIVVTLDTGVRVELRPEERDRGAQRRWLEATIAALQQAHALLDDAQDHGNERSPSSGAARDDA